ncbi:hypothetical protein [Deinococcus hohokamensis]|uniref:Uncharacterized protein n=1 Tax=Deinococcus hohokamensis TaxID=309883 RepID=A0ABV9ICZ3_9DEIO
MTQRLVFASHPRGAGTSVNSAPPIDPRLADTPVKRQQLNYLARCALRAGDALQTTSRGVLYTFKGEIGLAPGWTDRALTPTEQRWVSACMLAHVNYFEKHVKVMMEARHTAPVPFLTKSGADHRTYSIFEGAFFGNLFTKAPVAYACEGKKTAVQRTDPVIRDRVCSQPARTVSGRVRLSACGFVVTGPCEQPGAVVGGGRAYHEVINVYLRPQAR